MGPVKAVAQGCVTEPGLLLIPHVRQQLSEAKSHIQEGEVVALPAELSEPSPLEVRGGEPIPGKALNLNHVPCPVSPSLTAWRTAHDPSQGCHSCVGEEPVQHPPINHVSCSIGNIAVSFHQAPLWEPSVLASGWQALGDAGRTCCKPLGQHCHVTVPCGVQSLLTGRGQHPDKAVPGSLPSQRGLGL